MFRRELGNGGWGLAPLPTPLLCILGLKIPEGWGEWGMEEPSSGIQEVVTGFRKPWAVGHGWQQGLGQGGVEERVREVLTTKGQVAPISTTLKS